MASIYLAARYSRRDELLGYKADLEARGHTVTSRWLLGNHQVDDAGLSAEATAAERERFALEDYEDLCAASLLVAFSEGPRATNSRGGSGDGMRQRKRVPCRWPCWGIERRAP